MDELWKIKEQIAEESGYDMDKVFALIKKMEQSARGNIVNLSSSYKNQIGKSRPGRMNSDKGIGGKKP